MHGFWDALKAAAFEMQEQETTSKLMILEESYDMTKGFKKNALCYPKEKFTDTSIRAL